MWDFNPRSEAAIIISLWLVRAVDLSLVHSAKCISCLIQRRHEQMAKTRRVEYLFEEKVTIEALEEAEKYISS